MVVLYRVLMVCYVEFCYNFGERIIRDILFRLKKISKKSIISKVLKSTNRWCFLIPLLLSIFSVMQHNNLRDYLICTSREEQLRFNLENFWMSEEYPESLTTLPFYHPYEVLIQIVCKYCLTTKHRK